MTIPRKVKDPTTDIKEYNIGDFVQWLKYDMIQSVAVVTDIKKNHIDLIHFEEGIGNTSPRDPKRDSIRIISKDKALDHYKLISDNLEKEITYGGLKAAISAKRQHDIDSIISKIQEAKDPSDIVDAVKTPPKDPMTATYVLMGIYQGIGPSEHLQGLTLSPRLSEKAVSCVIKDLFAKGFGDIPPKVYYTKKNSYNKLSGYKAYEIPDKATRLVKDPKRLELKINAFL